MKINKRFYIDIAIVFALIGIVYVYREEAFSFVRRQYLYIKPCATPIRYTVGNIDPRFGVSETEIKKDIEKAVAIWEKSIDKDLFVYTTSSDDADLSIDFIYDKRQKTTDELTTIHSRMSATKSMYDELSATHKSMILTYNTDKAKLETMIEDYQSIREAYEKEVKYWNSHGGVPEKEHVRLEKSRATLALTQDQIIQKQQALNSIVKTLNQDTVTLNEWADTLNLNVKTYNEVGVTMDQEFEEGAYVSTIYSQKIKIYQYSDQTKLIRVLAHELGHALGLDHVENPQAIMYKLNEGVHEKLTSDDLIELNTLCGIETLSTQNL